MKQSKDIIKRLMQYLIYFIIFYVFSKLSLLLFQTICNETGMDIRELNILAVVFMLFYLCAVIPISLLTIKKVKEKWED